MTNEVVQCGNKDPQSFYPCLTSQQIAFDLPRAMAHTTNNLSYYTIKGTTDRILSVTSL